MFKYDREFGLTIFWLIVVSVVLFLSYLYLPAGASLLASAGLTVNADVVNQVRNVLIGFFKFFGIVSFFGFLFYFLGALCERIEMIPSKKATWRLHRSLRPLASQQQTTDVVDQQIVGVARHSFVRIYKDKMRVYVFRPAGLPAQKKIEEYLPKIQENLAAKYPEYDFQDWQKEAKVYICIGFKKEK